ncbi:MAG: HAD-IIA family hydrolase [Candidatus Lokiarchaeota archaeon]|nr:HAD-IIA family hydrolase [Candidatus Lokiarchaeota archaeon]
MNLLKIKNVFIFDLDGTIYLGEHLIPGAKQVVEYLQQKGALLYFLTNNGSKSRKGFVDKLQKMNIIVSEEQILSSGYVTSLKLGRKPNIHNIFVIGSNELISMIENEGLTTLNSQYSDSQLYAPILDGSIHADAIVTSIDIHFSYAKIRTAMELIHRGAEFYATNGDTTFPEKSQLWPGGGVMLKAVEACVGKEPNEIFGKPNIASLEMILDQVKEKGFSRKDMILIGDRLETDILQANRMGIESVLVETGVNKFTDIESLPDRDQRKELTPTYMISSIKDLLN